MVPIYMYIYSNLEVQLVFSDQVVKFRRTSVKFVTVLCMQACHT